MSERRKWTPKASFQSAYLRCPRSRAKVLAGDTACTPVAKVGHSPVTNPSASGMQFPCNSRHGGIDGIPCLEEQTGSPFKASRTVALFFSTTWTVNFARLRTASSSAPQLPGQQKTVEVQTNVRPGTI